MMQSDWETLVVGLSDWCVFLHYVSVQPFLNVQFAIFASG